MATRAERSAALVAVTAATLATLATLATAGGGAGVAHAAELPRLGVSVELPAGWTVGEIAAPDGVRDLLTSPDGTIAVVPSHGTFPSCPHWERVYRQQVRVDYATKHPPTPDWYIALIKAGATRYLCAELASSVLAVTFGVPERWEPPYDAALLAVLEALRVAMVAKHGAPVRSEEAIQLPGTALTVPAVKGWESARWKVGTIGGEAFATATDDTAFPITLHVSPQVGVDCVAVRAASGFTRVASPTWLPPGWGDEASVDAAGLEVRVCARAPSGAGLIVRIVTPEPLDGWPRETATTVLTSLQQQLIATDAVQLPVPPVQPVDPVDPGPDEPRRPASKGEMMIGIVGTVIDVRHEGEDLGKGNGFGLGLTFMGRPERADRAVGVAAGADVLLGFAAGGLTFHSKAAAGFAAGSETVNVAALFGLGYNGVGLGNDDATLFHVNAGVYALAEARMQLVVGEHLRVTASAGVYPRTGIDERRYCASIAASRVFAEVRYHAYGDDEHTPGGKMVTIGVGVAMPLETGGRAHR